MVGYIVHTLDCTAKEKNKKKFNKTSKYKMYLACTNKIKQNLYYTLDCEQRRANEIETISIFYETRIFHTVLRITVSHYFISMLWFNVLKTRSVDYSGLNVFDKNITFFLERAA